MAAPFLRNDLLACAGVTSLICAFAFLVWPHPGLSTQAHAADPARSVAQPTAIAPHKPTAYGEAFVPPPPSAPAQRPATAAARTSPLAGKPYPAIAPAVMAGNLISAPPPSLPLLARLAHVRGEVTVQAVISSNGSVAQARAVDGHHLLRGAALAEVRRRRYRPYRVDGQPANVSTLIKVDFAPQS